MINYSIIIPHRNSPVELARCLDSIPLRDDIEIIVVDDNSDEDKRPVITRSDLRLIFISREESKGAGRARNYGLRAATGKWLLFADCDDFYENDFLNVLDEYSTQDIDMLCFDVYYAYDLARRTEKWKNRYSLAIKEYLKNPTTTQLRTVKHIINNPWNFMVLREIPISNGIWFEEVPKGNDAYFHHMVSMRSHNVAVVDKKLYYWVWSDNGITHTERSTGEVMNGIEQRKKQVDMRIAAEAYDTVSPFFEGLGRILRTYGVRFTVRYFVKYLFCGIPWMRVWGHKLCAVLKESLWIEKK